MTSAMEPVGFVGIFEETRRVISVHSRHFLGLSVLLLLPISFLNCGASNLTKWVEFTDTHNRNCQEMLSGILSYTGNHLQIRLEPKTAKVLIYQTLYFLLTVCLMLCANATVIHSICNGFFGREVRLRSTIRSMPCSAWRLLVTTLVGFCFFLLVSFAFALVVFLGFFSVALVFNLQTQFMTPYASVVAFVILEGFAFYLQVHWFLAAPIVVTERKWGLEPLRRSRYLVNGMRWESLTLNLFFMVCGLGLMYWASYLQVSSSGALDFFLKTAQSITVLAALTVLELYKIATNAVFYMYCKAYHNELLGEIIQEFSHEYVILPFDDHKVPCLVTVAEV